MVISCIGDSLTQGDYGIKGKRGIANVQKENYPYFLQQLLQCEVRNFGKCGFKASNYLAYYHTGAVDVKNSNFIIVLLGTNGGFDLLAETADNNDFNTLLGLLRQDAPQAKILLCTPPHCTENPNYSNCGYAEQVAKATAFIRNYAAKNSYRLIDLALAPEFTAESEAVMQPNDGLHFGKLGYQTLAGIIAKEVRAAR